jgi:3',5'-cyclic AMP phosphodiesterase CpdA
MAGSKREALNRRQFIKGGLALAGGVVVLGPRLGGAGERTDKDLARWAFLSDTHVPADRENNYRDFYPYRNLKEVVARIAPDLPEGVVITGDLARLEGLPGDYANARKLLAPIVERRPVCVGLGNHDNRESFLKAFSEPGGDKQAVKGKHVVVVDAGPVRLIVLDTLMFVNKAPGLLGRGQRNWLADYLRTANDKPTLLFFHHTLGDGDGDLLDVPRLFDLIAPVASVKALVYGHSHVYRFAEHEGIHLINLPATGYNFRDDQPVGWVEARLTARGGQFTLHAIGGNTENDGRAKSLRWRA